MNPTPHSSDVKLVHEIFILDAYLLNELDASQQDKITADLVDELLSGLKMEKLGPMQLFEAVDNSAPGWTFVQTITTSHVSGHYFVKPGKHPNIRMDFYSCKKFDWTKIIDIVDTHLKLGEWRASFIERAIDKETDRTHLDIEGKGNTIIKKAVLS